MTPDDSERLDSIVTSGAARFGALPAVRDELRTLTFRDLEREVSAVAERLAATGVRAGHRVMVVGGNRAETIILFFAIVRLQAWAVLVSDRLAAPEIEALAAHCAPRSIVLSTAERELGNASRQASTLGVADGPGVRVEVCTRDDDDSTVDDRIAALLCTSGTTGSPKVVMLSHSGLLFIARTQAGLRRYGPGDRLYCPVPIVHAGGLASMTLGVLAGGGCIHLAPRFSPAALAAALRDDAITLVPGVPALHMKFATWVRATGARIDTSKVRMVSTASSPLDAVLKSTVETLYGVPLQNGYGLTETSAIVCQTPFDAPLPDTSVGPPFPGVSIRIVDAGGKDVAVDETGEILVRSPGLFLGYFRNEVATRAAFTSEGWFATGDLGRIDSNGRVFIAGRVRDIIKRSGFTVHPTEIESALNAHPHVAMSSVVGRPHGADEEIVAFVELDARAAKTTHSDVARFIAPRLASYKQPSIVCVLAQLPTLANGKVDKAALRQMAMEL